MITLPQRSQMLHVGYLHFFICENQIQLRWIVVTSSPRWFVYVLVVEAVFNSVYELGLHAL